MLMNPLLCVCMLRVDAPLHRVAWWTKSTRTASYPVFTAGHRSGCQIRTESLLARTLLRLHRQSPRSIFSLPQLGRQDRRQCGHLVLYRVWISFFAPASHALQNVSKMLRYIWNEKDGRASSRVGSFPSFFFFLLCTTRTCYTPDYRDATRCPW